jgi:hypothetical protein
VFDQRLQEWEIGEVRFQHLLLDLVTVIIMCEFSKRTIFRLFTGPSALGINFFAWF